MALTDQILLGTVALLLAASAFRDRAKTVRALRIGAKQFRNVLPFFIGVFGLIGLLTVMLTPDQIQRWLGAESGVLAPVYAAVLGGLATGPPAAVFPLGRYLLSQDASPAAVATLLIAWVAIGTVTLPAEVRFFGPRFAASRWTLAFVLSIALGIAMGWVL